MKRFSMLLGVLILAMALVGSALAQDKFKVTLEKADGTIAGTGVDTIVVSVPTGVDVRFIIRLLNDSVQNYAIGNGFEVYSTDGAVWDSTRGDTLGWRPGDVTPGVAILSKAAFDLPYTITGFSADGLAYDTVAFLGAKISGVGLVAGFNDTAWSVNAYGIGPENHGKTLCIDSAFFPPGGAWKWQASGGASGLKYPTWDGPHCYYIKDPNATAVDERENGLPFDFSLGQNYPNPFNPTTNINFDLPVNTRVNLAVYNVLGQKVRTLIDTDMDAGKYNVDWDGTNDIQVKVSSGIYFYKIEAGSFVQTKKMVMLK